MEFPVVLLNKNNMMIKKLDKNSFYFSVSLNNPAVYMKKLIQFSLLDMVYVLNKDIFDGYKLTVVNENEAIVHFLFKHFFVDLGVSQKYSHFYVKIDKDKDNDSIYFNFKTIQDRIPENLPNNTDLLVFDEILVEFKINNDHNVELSSTLTMNGKLEIFDFIEKYIIKIASKITLRIKQFIENYA